MTGHVKRFWRDEEGATAIEYGIIAFFMSILIIPGATLVGINLDAIFVLVTGFFPTP